MRSRTSILCVAALCCIAILSACETAGTAGGAASVAFRDSSGITIAENSGPRWADGEGWTVSLEPAVMIGQLQGSPEYLFSQVRSPLRLSDGRIAVLNRGTNQIRFYDSQGRHLLTTGGGGSGPGEYQMMQGMYRMPGDSLLVADRVGRYTVVAPDGQPSNFYPVDWQRAAPEGRLANGRLVISVDDRSENTPIDGYDRAPAHLVLYSPDTAAEDTVGSVRGSEFFVEEFNNGTQLAVSTPPFARMQSIATHGARIYTGSADTYEIEVRRDDGAVERIVRAARPARSVTASDVEVWQDRERERATNPTGRQSMERRLREMPIPETMPAYADLRVDSEGNLWVRDYAPSWEISNRWQIFDAQGEWLGGVDIPDGLEITDIGPDYVLGVHRDELGVESVRLHTLDKGVSPLKPRL